MATGVMTRICFVLWHLHSAPSVFRYDRNFFGRPKNNKRSRTSVEHLRWYTVDVCTTSLAVFAFSGARPLLWCHTIIHITILTHNYSFVLFLSIHELCEARRVDSVTQLPHHIHIKISIISHSTILHLICGILWHFPAFRNVHEKHIICQCNKFGRTPRPADVWHIFAANEWESKRFHLVSVNGACLMYVILWNDAKHRNASCARALASFAMAAGCDVWQQLQAVIWQLDHTADPSRQY